MIRIQFLIIVCLFSGLTVSAQFKMPGWVNKVGARSFPVSKKIFYVNDYGAKSDTSTINTVFIQKAIDDCAAKGGGIVSFRPGTYVTGALFIKSNVQFHVDKNVFLLGSQNFADYPEMESRKDYDRKGLRWIVDYDAKRVRTLLVQNSSDITIKNLTFKNAGFWTVQLLYSDHLTVNGVIIKNNEDGSGPSTDGIDVDSSS